MINELHRSCRFELNDANYNSEGVFEIDTCVQSFSLHL